MGKLEKIEGKIEKLQHEAFDLINTMKTLTNDVSRKPYEKRLTVIETELNNAVIELESEFTFEYLADTVGVFEVDLELGIVMPIREFIKLYNDGEISKKQEVFYTHDKKTTLYFGHFVNKTVLLSRKYNKIFTHVYVLNEDVDFETENVFKPFDEWDEEF